VAIFVKDPEATVDYAIDWSAGYLGDRTITGSTWRVAPGGGDAVNVEASAISVGGTTATLSGGMPGCLYHVTNTVTFSDSRTDERMLVLRVEDR
jgi:hypothetical protein